MNLTSLKRTRDIHSELILITQHRKEPSIFDIHNPHKVVLNWLIVTSTVNSKQRAIILQIVLCLTVGTNLGYEVGYSKI